MTVKHFYTSNFFSSHFGLFPDRKEKKKKKKTRKEGRRKKGRKQKKKKGEAVDDISVRKAALTWENVSM